MRWPRQQAVAVWQRFSLLLTLSMSCLSEMADAGLFGYPQALRRPASPGLVGAVTDGLRLLAGGWPSRGQLRLVQVSWDAAKVCRGAPAGTLATACT